MFQRTRPTWSRFRGQRGCLDSLNTWGRRRLFFILGFKTWIESSEMKFVLCADLKLTSVPSPHWLLQFMLGYWFLAQSSNHATQLCSGEFKWFTQLFFYYTMTMINRPVQYLTCGRLNWTLGMEVLHFWATDQLLYCLIQYKKILLSGLCTKWLKVDQLCVVHSIDGAFDCNSFSGRPL